MHIRSAMTIEEAIQQKQFKSEYHKAHINVLFTAAFYSQQTAKILKPFNISRQQFNILRILRGLHPQPASIKLLSERMIDKMSNASRLVDKLIEKGLVQRENCENDRRRVDVLITDQGLELLALASDKIEAQIEKQMSHLTPDEAAQLNSLLDITRG